MGSRYTGLSWSLSLDALSSNKLFPDPNTRYTKADMIEWCESWIAIYDKLS